MAELVKFSEYSNGDNARKFGLRATDNPWPADSWEHRSWLAGWQDADEMLRNEILADES